MPDVKPLSPSELTLQLESEKEFGDSEEEQMRKDNEKEGGEEKEEGEEDSREEKDKGKEGLEAGGSDVVERETGAASPKRKRSVSRERGDRMRRRREEKRSRHPSSPYFQKRHTPDRRKFLSECSMWVWVVG